MGNPADLLCHSPPLAFTVDGVDLEAWVTYSAPPATEPITVEAILRSCEALRSAVEVDASGFKVSVFESVGKSLIFHAFAETIKQANNDLMFALGGADLFPVSYGFPVILEHDSPPRRLKPRRPGSAAHRRFLRRQARQQ